MLSLSLHEADRFSYNSAIYLTAQANAYRVLAGPQEFLEASFNLTAFYADLSKYKHTDPHAPLPPIQSAVYLAQTLQHSILNTANFEKMDTVECATAYAQQYISRWGDLLVLEESTTLLYNTGLRFSNKSKVCTGTADSSVVNARNCTDCSSWFTDICAPYQECSCSASAVRYNITMNWDPKLSMWILPALPDHNSTIFEENDSGYDVNPLTSTNACSFLALYAAGLPTVYPSYAWQCPSGDVNEYTRSSGGWKPFGGSAVECWAEKIAESCTLNFSLTLGLIVVTCNATKFICMAMTIWRHREPALITIGDAIQSFLDRPDETTSGKCLYSGNQMHLFHEWSRSGRKAKLHERLVNESRLRMLRRPIYKSEKRSWASFASLGRWLACLCL